MGNIDIQKKKWVEKGRGGLLRRRGVSFWPFRVSACPPRLASVWR